MMRAQMEFVQIENFTGALRGPAGAALFSAIVFHAVVMNASPH
jgi:hypothetical protein